MKPSLNDIEAAIRAVNLAPRGAFYCTATDNVPAIDAQTPARSLILIGTIGSTNWPAFAAARTQQPDALNPLDNYSKRHITALARQLDASALFPFTGPPWLPFQRWAQRAEPVYPSALGPLIHPQYGLWHAYRGALSFARKIPGIIAPPHGLSPCESCAEKPCLHTCPVSAFSSGGYNVPVCVDHLGSDSGQPCMSPGCLARQACPHGKPYRYLSDHAQFHMQAFFATQSS